MALDFLNTDKAEVYGDNNFKAITTPGLRDTTISLEVFSGWCENAGLVMSNSQTTSYVAALFIQASLETASFTSRLYLDENNLFGMRPSKARTKYYQDISNTSNGQFASYESPVQSIMDRVDLDRYNSVPMPNSINLVDLMVWLNKVLEKGYVPQGERAKYRQLFTSYYNRLIQQVDAFEEEPNSENANNGGLLGFFGGGDGDGDGMGKGFLSFKLLGIPLIALIIGFFGWRYFKKGKFF